MTQKQMIDMVQRHHPELNSTEVRIYLQDASDKFCKETRILQGYANFDTVADQRYYNLNDLDGDDSTADQYRFIDVERVEFSGFSIDRLTSPPQKRSDA